MAVLLVGCSSNNTKQNDTTPSPSANTSVERSEVEAYRPPSNVIKIDLKVDEPSNSQITFKYDDEGKISQCYYKIDNTEIYLSYTYDGNKIQIYGFSGSIVVADEVFEAKADFDPTSGFVEYKGYYIKGFNF